VLAPVLGIVNSVQLAEERIQVLDIVKTLSVHHLDLVLGSLADQARECLSSLQILLHQNVVLVARVLPKIVNFRVTQQHDAVSFELKDTVKSFRVNDSDLVLIYELHFLSYLKDAVLVVLASDIEAEKIFRDFEVDFSGVSLADQELLLSKVEIDVLLEIGGEEEVGFDVSLHGSREPSNEELFLPLDFSDSAGLLT